MGYVKIDLRASHQGVREYDTEWCRHCQAVIDIKKWREDGGIWKCLNCRGPLCQNCAEIMLQTKQCDSIWAKVDRWIKQNEEEQKRLRLGI